MVNSCWPNEAVCELVCVLVALLDFLFMVTSLLVKHGDRARLDLGDRCHQVCPRILWAVVSILVLRVHVDPVYRWTSTI